MKNNSTLKPLEDLPTDQSDTHSLLVEINNIEYPNHHFDRFQMFQQMTGTKSKHTMRWPKV